ncbi:unnamed protein product [Closterium sp. NIES-64]|nr:unnamed protein product [Closterium sp. NIES-64]
MNRPSFRPRPVDINKKLAIVRSTDELNAEDEGVSRTVHHGHIALDAENEQVQTVASLETLKDIPSVIPCIDDWILQGVAMLTPTSINPARTVKEGTVRGDPDTSLRRGRSDDGVYVEYDLDDEDEDWLEVLNQNRLLLAADRLEWMIYQMELLDARARAKAGTAMLAGAVDQTGAAWAGVIWGSASAGPAAAATSCRCSESPGAKACAIIAAAYDYWRSKGALGANPLGDSAIIAAAYDYWRSKRERWGKPILRRLQPSPAITDTNPFNVFRPRERAHRPNTRRMQRRENDMASYEKLVRVRLTSLSM